MKTPYQNRELSWLKFNERVLEEAEESSLPLYERLKFLSIYLSNLDEFFMVRVGMLQDQNLLDPKSKDNKTHMTPAAQLSAIFQSTRACIPRQNHVFAALRESLSQAGISLVSPSELNKPDETYLRRYFTEEIFPLLSPQIVGKHHPFPFLRNCGLYLAIHLSSKNKKLLLGLIPVSNAFDRVVILPGASFRFCLVEDVICFYASSIFKKYNIVGKTVLKVTRNADTDLLESQYADEDYLHTMKHILEHRKKLAPVRLNLFGKVNPELQKYLAKKLGLDLSQIFCQDFPLDLSFVFKLESQLSKRFPLLFFAPYAPRLSRSLVHGYPYIPQILKRDILLSYPYESIGEYIKLLEEAAEDPFVISIKITLYRVAPNSRVIGALVQAANNGKEVFAVVELRARFDEQNNIGWAEYLEEAGVTLSYGLDQMKTHAKLTLITRKTPELGIHYITQTGTGNYNEKTARQYTDLCLLTANNEIGYEAARFFQDLSLGEVPSPANLLLISPRHFRNRLLDLFDEQIAVAREGGKARVLIKCNSLADLPIMKKMVEASRAGVKIRMIIRGICCLIPQLPGYTENIEVVSIVGRFLEHSRVYVFGSGPNQKVYLSSADLMARNTERRVEVACPVLDSKLQGRILHMLGMMLNDTSLVRIQNSRGEYVRPSVERSFNCQEYFMNHPE